MRIVFMGTPDFAVVSLRAVAASYDVVGVYTRPDAVSGRGGTTRPSPVKCAALQLGLEVMQPPTLRDDEVHRRLAALRPDVCVVAAYGAILPRAVLEIPPLGCINVHGSLLPRWRGAAPVQRAILAGDTLTGVSIMRMEEGLDTGPFCETETVEVGDKSAAQLTDELAHAGAKALLSALERVATGECEWTVQDESLVTYADKLLKSDVALDELLSVDEALRRIRASGPSAPARVAIAGRTVTVVSAVTGSPGLAPGAVYADKNKLELGFANGSVRVDMLKPEGKREMDASQWVCGLRVESELRWGRI